MKQDLTIDKIIIALFVFAISMAIGYFPLSANIDVNLQTLSLEELRAIRANQFSDDK